MRLSSLCDPLEGPGQGVVLSGGEVLSFHELETPVYCALEIVDLNLFCHR